MKKLFRNNKFRIAVILVVLVITAATVSIHRSRNTNLLDKDTYSSFKESVDDASYADGGFADQRALMDLIEAWADERSLEYKEDKYGNIIFNTPAIKRKSNVTPTLIAVSINYETAAANSHVLASAAAIAASDVESGRRTVVFFNDEKGLAKGYKGLNKKYISSKTKVIYLDGGSSTYLSTGSFQQRNTEVAIPAKQEANPCDTVIKISISGIKSDNIGPGIGNQPDPVLAFSNLLTRLKSKSVDFRLADVNIGSNGNMYPVSLDATVTLNSYNLSSFTAYIEKRIKTWEKTYGSGSEGLSYSYEVLEDEELIPETVYSAETTDRLTGILYTIRSGAYKYSENDAIPESKSAGDIYGFNCITDIEASEKNITIPVLIQGANDSFAERILNDNRAAAELYECKYSEKSLVEAFSNTRDKLSRTFQNTYQKVNDSSSEPVLSADTDDYFTPCSYLQGRNSKSDIIHLSVKESSASRIANTILCYIKTKGNTSIFK